MTRSVLLNFLKNNSYIKTNLVTSTGEYAVRSFIIDVFPINSKLPVRFEFFGNDLESIRYFDFETQISTDNINEITLYSFSEDTNSEKEVIYDKLNNPFVFFVDYKNIVKYYDDYNLIDNWLLKWNEWIGIQYTDEGTIPGVRDLVDRDYFTENIFYEEGDKFQIEFFVDNSENHSKLNILVCYNEIKNKLTSYRNQSFIIPQSINAVLREYQVEGYKWLKTLDYIGFGGILGDEMGLGKTLQTITFLASNEGKKSLIVAPTSLVYNWENEIYEFVEACVSKIKTTPKKLNDIKNLLFET